MISDREQWGKWLRGYGAEKFYDAFMENAQGARSQCIQCDKDIYLDIAEGGGVTDWRTADGDYGCFESPETSEEGTGPHMPSKG